MKKKECPSCAMEIDAAARLCPICNYEFPTRSKGLKWAALLLALVLLFYLIFF